MTRHAIVLPCDKNYLPYALHLIWQLRTRCAQGAFDIWLISQDVTDIPEALKWLDVQIISPGEVADLANSGSRDFPISSSLRLYAAELLGDRYDRLLCLDSDIFFESGDLSRLFGVDLRGKAIGAALDGHYLSNPRHQSPEFKLLGCPDRPYFNAGVMLVDTAIWRRERITERALEFAAAHPEVILYTEQSALNGVLRGEFTEISPAWNWTGDSVMRYVSYRFPVRLRHFAGLVKAWGDPYCVYDVRFRRSYHDFFRAWLPEALSAVDMEIKRGPTNPKIIAVLFWAHVKMRPKVSAIIGRFETEFEGRMPLA